MMDFVFKMMILLQMSRRRRVRFKLDVRFKLERNDIVEM